MIRIPQVRVVDEEGAQLGVMPTPQALAMAQERGLDLVEVAPLAAPPVVKFLDFGQYKYELTKREKENKRRQRSVTFKEVRLSPKIGLGRLRDEGPSRDRVPRGRRSHQGDRPVPGSGADPSGARPEHAHEVHGSNQGTRGRRAGAAPRGEVDAPHGRIASQAQGARARPASVPGPRTGPPTRRTDRSPLRHRRRSRRPTARSRPTSRSRRAAAAKPAPKRSR